MIALDRLEAGLTGTQVHANKRGNVSARSWKTYPGGYPMIAERIASKPQTAIYRRFDALNARRILYLQAELCALEKQLHDVEEEDARKGLAYAFNYQRILEANNGEGNVQPGLVKAMHKKLNEYNEALIQVSTLSQIKPPQRFDLTDIQHLLESKAICPNFLQGIDRGTWGTCDHPEDHAPDLIGVHPRPEADGLSRLIAEKAIHLFSCGLDRCTKGNSNLGPKVYYDSTILMVTSWITCILASLLPIASILVLLNVQSLKTKLWLIAAFNVLVSICLRTLTDAKRSEAFAITAAFAAVQVVFVGTGGNTCTG